MSGDSELLRFDQIDGAETSWLWPERIAVGQVTVVAGEAASGKSLLVAELAARVSSGEAWPDEPATDGRPRGSVVIAQADRHLSAVVKRRLTAAGADLRQLALLERDGELPAGRTTAEVLLNRLQSALEQVPDCSLLIVDHLPGWLRTANPRPDERAAVFDRLAELAAHRQIALVVVWRLEKTVPGGPGRALDALLPLAPVVWMLARDPYRDNTFRAVCAQNQLGRLPDNLAFRVEGDRLVWRPMHSQATADEVVAATARSVDRYERRQAGQWLLELLAAGPIEAGRLWEEARQCRLSERTVRRAAAELDLHPMKVGQRGPWLWGFRGDMRCSAGREIRKDQEAVAILPASEAASENVAALETVGSLPNSAVVQVELRRDASPSVTSTGQIDATSKEAGKIAAHSDGPREQVTREPAAAATASEDSASQNVAALEPVGSLEPGEAASRPAQNAEERRLRKLSRERKAMLDFQNVPRSG